MLTCKQVSNALARQDYATLSVIQRSGLKLHVAICLVCGQYNRQVMLMQDAARVFRSREDQAPAPHETTALSAHDKESMKRALRQTK